MCRDPHTWAAGAGRIHVFLLFSPPHPLLSLRSLSSPLSTRGFQLLMPGWTWLQGGGGDSLSLPPPPSPHPSSLLLPLPALCLPPSFSSAAVESPRSREPRKPGSQTWLGTEVYECGSWHPSLIGGPGLRLGAAVSSGGPVRDRAGARGPSRRARRRAGAASGRVRGRTAEGRETAAAEGRGRRAEGGERPGSRRAPPRRNRALCPRLRRVGGRAPGRPRVRSKSPANSGGRAPPSPASSPLRIAAWPGHVSAKPGRQRQDCRRSSRSPEPRAQSPAPG